MKLLILLTMIALSANVYAGKKSKKVMHDKEHHHVNDKADEDHTHDDAHHKPHDHQKHHPNHEEDLKKDGDKHLKHVKMEAQAVEEVK
ncbi:MAG: hypothetical protein ACOYL6_16815 [Bacteriovoracaceae bacterium]